MNPFCKRHTIHFLTALAQSTEPLDLALSRYFRLHKNLGSKDRKTIGDVIYGMTRWKGLLDWIDPQGSIERRFECYQSLDWNKTLQRPDIPQALRCGLPLFVYEKLRKQYGEAKAEELGQILNSPAPTTIRANLLKISRQELMERWKDRFAMTPCKQTSAGIQFAKREPLFTLPEFKEGLFEMQDEGSQMVADLVEAKPGDLVLDFCSGSGGKSLSIAPAMQGKGQIYLHDVRKQALLEAKRRLRRAGIQNAQCLDSSHPQMQRLLAKCDWVLVDAPCSGTGTFRRNPDQKWKLDEATLARLTALQKEICQKAACYVKPGGKLVYATCSLLKEENEQQLASLPFSLQKTLVILPEKEGPDAFFAAVLEKN
ncbi:MAG: RsmB/NOP family class I SAM-dependent RNA methyltransferase [Chlamydiia bacterium]|nr:RsmB/NOP family class I SAM-dependent RNA methyltransferase [Chlamydiia bacterium]